MIRLKRLAIFAVVVVAASGCSDDSSTPPDSSPQDSAVDQPVVVPDTATDTAPDAPVLTGLLTNEFPCQEQHPLMGLAPDPGEEGHLAAARLTPESYPFTVKSVRYTLLADEDKKWSVNLAHRVEVYVTTASAPEATPTVKETIDVPAATETVEERTIVKDLAAPITLQTGEHLIVAVEMAGDAATAVLCLRGCPGHGIADRNYWSNATQPPYDWKTLDSLGIDTNLLIQAVAAE